MSEETLLQFPCEFPIKVMGKANDAFEVAVLTIIRKYVPSLAENALKIKPSKDGNYTAITITIQAQSKQQMDSIYQELTASEHVLVAL